MAWDRFISVAGWAQHVSPAASRPFGHLRSLSAITRSSSPKPPRPAGKTPSTSELPDLNALGVSQPHPSPQTTTTTTTATTTTSAPSYGDDGGELSTLPDPRSRAVSPSHDDDGRGDGASAPAPAPAQHHPDLNDEIATLSTKLVNAINRQTSLDDTLSATRVELDAARRRIRELEAQTAQQREMLAGDVWVRRKTVEAEKKTLLSRAADEKALRLDADKARRRMEQELEALTAALFEEANKMVVRAKEEAQRDHELLQRKNDQLRAQLADTEGLVESQREQLTELKHVMEQMSDDRDDSAHGTAPSSPGFGKFDCAAGDDDGRAPSDAAAAASAAGATSNAAVQAEAAAAVVSPTHPTSFTHLLQPVLRSDISLYDDFTGLVRQSRRRPGSRLSSGSHAGPLSAPSAHPSNASTASLSTAPSPASSAPQTPNTPASAVSAASAAAAASSAGSQTSPGPPPALRESRFFKRVLAEDVEPTLRLDLAPGLSWLARRGVVSSMAEGTLVVEPAPAKAPLPGMTPPRLYPCSLCGESRRDAGHLRTHRFRTSESDSAQRYPLCGYCLGRVRSTCDFLGFLRIVKDGHWRADDEDAELAAWEESVRLREQMFWARIGGGVVPVGHAPAAPAAPAPSEENHGGAAVQEGEAVEVAVPAADPEAETEADAALEASDETVPGAASQVALEQGPPPEAKEDVQTPPSSVRNSTQSLEVKASPASDKESAKRLSITIPQPDQQ